MDPDRDVSDVSASDVSAEQGAPSSPLAADAEPSASHPVAGGGELEFMETGVRWPGRGSAQSYLAYRDLLHVSLTRRALRVSTSAGAWALARSRLREPGAALLAFAELRRRVGALPDGEARLAQMEVLDERFRSTLRSPRLCWALILTCMVMAVLQVSYDQTTQAGALRLGLTAVEPWRAVTAHFLHGMFGTGVSLFSPHLVLNVLCLWALGGLVERTLGVARTALVVLAAAVGAAWASVAWGYAWVVGASGLVMGLAGALVWLEFRRPEELPAAWRLSRMLLLLAFGFEMIVVGSLPVVASAAHWGGLLAGGLVTALVTGPGSARHTGTIRRLAVAGAVATLLAFGAFGWTLVAPDQASVRRANWLLDNDDASPTMMNDEAWTIAISTDPDEDSLRKAWKLAERAVDATQRRNPDLLDTLAEVLFQLGHADRAVGVSEEAISLSPAEPYFREQRRRFLGERDPNDRPAPPGSAPRPPRRDPRDRPIPASEDSILV